jgi:hypothetical protein
MGTVNQKDRTPTLAGASVRFGSSIVGNLDAIHSVTDQFHVTGDPVELPWVKWSERRPNSRR